ncbi:MAG: efflux RND transporter periplasmic adaptor subunit [Deltaproteobacteria bacterium]|nr:efflux RND transporter periplasmic adaptor subunit [Deltaproteobacteria bacterium]MBW2403483.1 efflux RND transporter periplasmic adaptor subunit [Deltaproteobacteria bacterium]
MAKKPTLIAMAAVLAMVGCEDVQEEPEVIRPVRYEVVEGSDSATRRTFSGVSKSGQESRLSFQVSGQVVSVPINVGDTVKKGDTIARMDPADYALQLQNAQASAAQSRAQERNAKATYERTRALYENQNASRQDLDADRTAYESGRAGLEASHQQVRLRQRQLGYTHLKAPETGTLATVDIEVNEYVQAGELVATLLAGEQIEVSVSVPASVIRSIKKGAEAKARFNSLEGKVFAGTVTEVGVASVGGATTFPVTVRLTEGQDQVRAGMSADVTFVFASEKDGPRYSLPISAVGEDREGRFVFILEKTGDALGTVHRTPVEVGEILSDGIEILDGVKPGDLVVTAGVSRIYDGLQVRVPERPGSEPDNVAGDPAPTTEANVTP